MTRTKRQVRGRSSQANDENQDPFVARDDARDTQDAEGMDLDNTSTKSTKSTSTPIKHGRMGGRVALSPTKINTHFRTSKATVSQAVDAPTKVPRTPQTPRHRDALSKQGLVTPRHRVTVVGRPSSAQTPRTPRTPATPGSSLPTVYNAARQLFARSSNPGRLVGRDAERHELNDFIEAHVASRSGGCIYISGPPGTGKSALVKEVCEGFAERKSIRVAHVNCMSMKSPKDIYSRLVEEFDDQPAEAGSDEMEILRQRFVTKATDTDVCVVTLDEIDHLLTLDLETLYTLFEWSMQRPSKLILVGIANALDLTDRFLPRLKARNLKPQLLPFLPYTAPQIETVVTTRLKSLLSEDSTAVPGYVPFVHPTAISLCSRKVASQSGDLRKAFEMSRRAIDVIESETKQKHLEKAREEAVQMSPSKGPLTDNTNLSSPPSAKSSPQPSAPKVPSHIQSLMALTPETAPRATVAHIARIASAAFGNGTAQRLQSLNLQQKAALCALVALERRKRTALSDVMATPSKTDRAAPTVRVLYETYASLCKRDRILHPLTSTEFRDVVVSLETLSLISAVDGRNGSFVGMGTPSKRRAFGGMALGGGDEKRVASCVSEGELEQVVEGVGAGILKGILSGEGLH